MNTVAPLLRAEVAALETDIPPSAITLLDRAMTQSRWGHRIFAGMFIAFAMVGLVLPASASMR